MISAVIRASAVGGITMVWTYFTLKAFKTCRQIVFPPSELKEIERKCEHCSECCSEYFSDYDGSRNWVLYQSVYVCERCAEKKEVMCQECKEKNN